MQVFGAITKSANFDVHGVISEEKSVHDMHANAEQV